MQTTLTLTPSQEKVYHCVRSGLNVFLTGNAGTGKSFLLRRLIADMKADGKNVVVAAPTGIAAINAGGTTLHRLFQLKPGVYTEKRSFVPEVLKQTDVLFIDEISMCRIDLFDYIGRVLQQIHRNVQVVVVGDFCQLPPVLKKGNNGYVTEKDILDAYFGFDVGGAYAFESPQWDRLNFKPMALREVIRQENEELIQALDRVRLGDSDALSYFTKMSCKNRISDGIYLAGRNKEVEALNKEKLDEINSRLFVYDATSTGEVTREDKSVAPEQLTLKVGARVMTTCNDEEGHYVNGSMGYVTHLDKDHIRVDIDESGECEINKYTWEIVRFVMEEDAGSGIKTFKRKKIGEYVQYPLKLAYAVTIHKSQGQTFSKVNLNPFCWDSGQLYVALSRIRDIDGLHLTRYMNKRYNQLDPVVREFYENLEDNVPEDAGIARRNAIAD